jgi:hypothetical protein
VNREMFFAYASAFFSIAAVLVLMYWAIGGFK